MSTLRPAPVSTAQFTWDRAHRMLVTEISNFGHGFDFGRVYDDACDEGVTLVSEHTGRQVVFAVNHIERDREGDLLYWDLIPASHADCNCTVRIFND